MIEKIPRSAFWSAPIPWYWKLAPIVTAVIMAVAVLSLPGGKGVDAGDSGGDQAGSDVTATGAASKQAAGDAAVEWSDLMGGRGVVTYP
jgi:hypothetical protein